MPKNIIGNNVSGRLFIFKHKPVLRHEYGEEFWGVADKYPASCDELFEIDNKEFPEVTFENSPQVVELKIKR